MSRLIYWNLQDFAQNKIANAKTTPTGAGGLNPAERSQQRLLFILWMIHAADPEIFILVETETGRNDVRGQVVRSNPGAVTLLQALQGLNNNWRLVPPIKTGPSEAVSVYYRQENLIFTGPWRWPGGAQATAQPGGNAADYPFEYNQGIGNRVIPQGAQYNVGQNERQMAAQIAFNFSADHPNFAGQNINFRRFRAPYMTTFAELNQTGNVSRNLTLFGIHAPASNNARQYLRELANIAQISDGLTNNEARVIAGDFNWNLLQNDWTMRTSYQPLINRGYTLELSPPNPPNNNNNGFPWYFATHMKPTNSAVYWSTNNNTVYYPGYGYFSDTNFAIDNIFTRYGTNAHGPSLNFTVFNPIVGAPYDRHPPPTPNTPIGDLDLPIVMNNQVYQNPVQPGMAFQNGLPQNFRGWTNFGGIRSTSDHLPLVVDL